MRRHTSTLHDGIESRINKELIGNFNHSKNYGWHFGNTKEAQYTDNTYYRPHRDNTQCIFYKTLLDRWHTKTYGTDSI